MARRLLARRRPTRARRRLLARRRRRTTRMRTKKRRLPPEPRPSFFNRDGTWKRYDEFAPIERLEKEYVPRPRFKWGRELMGLPPKRKPKSE
jgi:hypothetical protein